MPNGAAQTDLSTPETACGCVEASCVCSLPKGHEDLTHHCDCGGEWRYDPESGEFEAITLPGPFAGMGIFEAMGAMTDLPEPAKRPSRR